MKNNSPDNYFRAVRPRCFKMMIGATSNIIVKVGRMIILTKLYSFASLKLSKEGMKKRKRKRLIGKKESYILRSFFNV